MVAGVGVVQSPRASAGADCRGQFGGHDSAKAPAIARRE
jgi:hypothetical protein